VRQPSTSAAAGRPRTCLGLNFRVPHPCEFQGCGFRSALPIRPTDRSRSDLRHRSCSATNYSRANPWDASPDFCSPDSSACSAAFPSVQWRLPRLRLVYGSETKLRTPQAKLANITAENNSGAEEFVQHIVEHYMDRDAWFRQKVRTGLDHLAHGDFVTQEEIGARRALIRCSARKIGFAGQLPAFEIGLYCSYGGIRRSGCPSGCA